MLGVIIKGLLVLFEDMMHISWVINFFLNWHQLYLAGLKANTRHSSYNSGSELDTEELCDSHILLLIEL